MSVAGTYEYVKPGSMQKSTQKLTLTADGRVEYSETGSTGMEDFEAVGQGTWKIEGNVCNVFLSEIKKEMKFKFKTNVPGIEDGTNVRRNVTMPITTAELINAPRHGTNKWKRV